MNETMATGDFLADLTRQGVHLWAEGEALRYRAPQSILTAGVREELRRRKTEILELLQRRQDVLPRSGISQIRPDPLLRHQPFPLTDIQQAYWVGRHAGFELGASAHLYKEREIEGLDLGRFAQAWHRLMDRHEMLRAVFGEDGQQRIRERADFEMPLLDLRALDDGAAQQELARLRARMKREGPRLDVSPFEICASLRQGGVVHVHLTLSLLICDGLSSDLIFQELIQLYASPSVELPPLALSFRDYVAAVAEAERSESYRRSLEFWRQRLPTLPPAPELPLARRPGDLRAPRFVRRTRTLSPSVWSRLREKAAQQGLTPTVVVCCAYSEVLAAWSKSQHFLLNVLFFSRPLVHPQVNQVVGNFSTTILLEVDAASADTFAGRAGRLQDRLWADIEHAQVSGIRVLRELHRMGEGVARPIVPVVFASTLGLEPGRSTVMGGTTGEERPDFDTMQTPQVWLDHQVRERDGSLFLVWDALDDLFPPGMVDHMLAAYADLLHRLAAGDQAWTDRWLGLVPAAMLETRARANDTAAPVSGELLHTLFARQALAHPERTAVLAPGRDLTYGELQRWSRQLGHRLREMGAGPGRVVAVLMERGWEQMVAVLAVLESGAAYVPVDAALPEERRLYLLEHAQADLALTQPWLDTGLDWPAGVRRLVVAEPGDGAVDIAPEPPVQKPGDLAYIIYTSGSTGLPKGVMIDHRGAVNTILDVNERFGIGSEDRVLALSSLSFDLSVYDVFGILAAGGAVVLPERRSATEPAHWLELCRRHRVSVWNSVPALMEMLVDYTSGVAEELPESLRLVMISGDWIPVSLPGRIRRMRPETQVVSLGGATEASIWSICYPVEKTDPSWTSIPYGYPMANQAFHVLNERLDDSPDWVAGSLFIEGVGLAQGYWRDEERTAKSFLSHPRTGRRIYRTGDLGRYLRDGNLEILGREDFQVKVQGYRIELGEIEAALVRHPGVRNAAVVALGQARGSKRLVAALVPRGEEENGLLEDVHSFLTAQLPAYMVPATLVPLRELPLSANGKVDRGALTKMLTQGAGRSSGFVPPRNDLELVLSQIWQEVLERPALSVRDNFFELGGHSLLAVRMMTRLRERLGRELALSTLLEAPTIEALAAVVSGMGAEPARSTLVGIQTTGSRPPFFCVHPVGGNVLCYVDLARELGPDQPFFGVQVPDFGEASPVSLPFEEIAAGYVAALRERQPEGPYRLGGWSMGGCLAFEMACQIRAQGGEVASLVLIDVDRPLNAPVTVDDATLVSWFAHDLGSLLGRELDVSVEDLRPLDSEERLALLLGRAREAALTQDVTLEHARHMLAVFLRNFRALLRYVPPAYPGSLTILRASRGAEENEGDPSLGWAARAAGPVEVEIVPGNHYTMMRPPLVAALADALRRHLRSS